MSRTHSRPSNKHENYLNIYSNNYLYSGREPFDSMSSNPMSELEVELIDDCESGRRWFRNRARSLRI